MGIRSPGDVALAYLLGLKPGAAGVPPLPPEEFYQKLYVAFFNALVAFNLYTRQDETYLICEAKYFTTANLNYENVIDIEAKSGTEEEDISIFAFFLVATLAESKLNWRVDIGTKQAIVNDFIPNTTLVLPFLIPDRSYLESGKHFTIKMKSSDGTAVAGTAIVTGTRIPRGSEGVLP